MHSLPILDSDSRSIIPPPDIQHDIISLGFDYRFGRSMWLFSLVLVVYDYLLTFEDEIEFLWKGRFTFTRALFFTCRYWPVSNLILDNIVLTLQDPSEKSHNSAELVVGLILLLRIHAIGNYNRRSSERSTTNCLSTSRFHRMCPNTCGIIRLVVLASDDNI
ncbi:hypothetical protein ABKN59_009421 [Abortiporus biennis]